mmetsp:Transcript_13624/g.43540  ORF Transcript_13624/g.43540 Transcript_13624/m.43540 type:complete len:315 (+) Transcript_13624:60-1004(+)
MAVARVAAQATLRRAARFSGIGLHSGEACSATVAPAPVDSGIRFTLSGRDRPPIPADFRLAKEVPLCTELVDDTTRVQTIEHMMAALFALGVSNCEIALEGGAEVPVLDGSAFEFVDKLSPLVELQDASLPVVRVTREVVVEDPIRGTFAKLEPAQAMATSDPPVLDLTIELDSFDGRLPTHPEGCTTFQYTHVYGQPESALAFTSDLAPARTFGFESDIARLRQAGLAQGGSLDNAVVFRGDGTDAVLNPEGLRFPDEWVRHKMLDCIGDLGLSLTSHGVLHGSFFSRRPGHATTNKLLRAVFASPDNYEIIS